MPAPAPQPLGKDWKCPHCPQRLGVVVGAALRVVVPMSLHYADRVEVRCPNCHSKQTFWKHELAA